MKNVLAPTENRRKLRVAFDALQNQDGLVSVRMGLVTGPSGAGKTKAIANLAMNSRVSAIYVSCSSNDSANALLARICKEMGAGRSHRTVDMQDFVVERLSLHQQPLFVDEVNSLFDLSRRGIPKKALAILETLRYLHDQSKIPLFLVGTELVRERLVWHEQLDRRISQRVEFSPMSVEDAMSVVESCCEVAIDMKAVEEIYTMTAGSIGRFTVILSEVERYCQSQGWEGISLKQYKDWWNGQKSKGQKGGII